MSRITTPSADGGRRAPGLLPVFIPIALAIGFIEQSAPASDDGNKDGNFVRGSLASRYNDEHRSTHARAVIGLKSGRGRTTLCALTGPEAAGHFAPTLIQSFKAHMTEDLMTILATLEKPGQPGTTFKAIDALTKSIVGHQLFTLLCVDGEEVARVYSNRPVEYPVSGRKPMAKTPWGDLLLRGCKPYLGRDKEGIRWAFFDHALIESMGLGSAINIPVVYDGACLGTMNLLDAEHHYREEHVPLVAQLAPLLIPAFLEARRNVASPEAVAISRLAQP